MDRVIHFELSVEEPERTTRFYSDVFGWKASKWEGPMEYWLVSTGPRDKAGIDGAFMLRSETDERLSKCARITIGVSSIDESLEKIEKSGGKVLMPKTPIPGVGYGASFEDTEGNIISLMQDDPSAK
jgi:predicted enzyme related to lactoylglutathione lyase